MSQFEDIRIVGMDDESSSRRDPHLALFDIVLNLSAGAPPLVFFTDSYRLETGQEVLVKAGNCHAAIFDWWRCRSVLTMKWFAFWR
jgi:hypothetical protein